MAKKEKITLTGTVKWAHKLFEPDQYEDNDPRYTVSFYPDATSREIFLEKKKQYKLANRIRQDDEGTFVVLGRPHLPKVFKGKVIFRGGPPKVTDADGNPWDTEKLVGNGSAVEIVTELYQTKKNGGSRILSVKITDWVEYEAEDVEEADAAVNADEEIVPHD